MPTFLIVAAITAAALALVTLVITALPRVAPARADAWARAPRLDVIMAALTWVPWVAAGIAAGWAGVGAALVAQFAVAYLWVALHELVHRDAVRGPRLVKAHNRFVGRLRNHTALWVSAIAVPLFWGIRFAQIGVYPLFPWLVGFPAYRHGDWINVSRHKFDGLVGHDLLWCLYCDWMTGVYALGGEMLRNVESFWCPIRFIDAAKCANCRVDFPDVESWVPPDGTMADAERMLMDRYADGRRELFGHPARLTVEGSPASEDSARPPG